VILEAAEKALSQ